MTDFQWGAKRIFFGRCHEQQGQNYAVSCATASEIFDPIFSYFFNKFRRNKTFCFIKFLVYFIMINLAVRERVGS